MARQAAGRTETDSSVLMARIVVRVVIFEAKRPIAITCVTYSPDFAQWKCQVSPGKTMTLPGG